MRFEIDCGKYWSCIWILGEFMHRTTDRRMLDVHSSFWIICYSLQSIQNDIWIVHYAWNGTPNELKWYEMPIFTSAKSMHSAMHFINVSAVNRGFVWPHNHKDLIKWIKSEKEKGKTWISIVCILLVPRNERTNERIQSISFFLFVFGLCFIFIIVIIINCTQELC